jgi:membrane protein required for colicin V production
MTLFDIAGALILGVSALVGLARGAIREVTFAVSFVAAAFLSVFALRFTGPIALRTVHPAWAANTAAVLLVFVAAYILLRTLAGALARSAHETRALGAVDRLVGGGVGLVRGLVALGIIGLGLGLAGPRGHMPDWIASSKLYPVSEASAAALRALAPKGGMMAASLKPAYDKAVAGEETSSGSSSAVGRSADSDYSAAARKGLDDVVERSR